MSVPHVAGAGAIPLRIATDKRGVISQSLASYELEIGKKKNFSPRALRDIAILKLPILPYSDTMVIGHSVPLFDNQLNIL